ncbi:MAG: amino acid ABC transporter substrate-binding protein [Streptosporangiaceae bacterium]|nr:amino acid ABC transporter substrate-binding protein [Streptosporangiaceae bacterium]MBV9857660.1 amino acid ABC transporter substrate-binding protein [Streptosporangiaceae bacterium]
MLTTLRRTNSGRRPVLAAFIAAGVATAGSAGLAACASSSSSPAGTSPASGGTLTVADLAPFSGPDAALGPTYLVSCDGATQTINQAGGVLGHKLTCKGVDTRGDPADAVPAARQMFATTSGLALVIGVTSDEAASVVPVINADKMVVFAMTGQSEFDSVHFQYFYRLVPPDLEESYAMIAIAQQLGYKKIALAFGNDIGSQTFIQPAISAIGKAGMTLAANETLDLSASTFRTEAQKIVAAHPDVILTEALGPTDATFLSEVKQLNGGKMIPVIGTSATISPDWYKSVAAAVGAPVLASGFHADNLVTETSGPSYTPFYNAIMSQRGKTGSTGNFATYLTAPGAVHLYDGINLAALAMTEAKSTSPAVYAPYIEKIGDGTPGAEVVYSFAQGVAALKQGKAIRYEGPGGPTSFDSYHDSTGIFQIDTYSPSGAVQVSGNITPAQLRALS